MQAAIAIATVTVEMDSLETDTQQMLMIVKESIVRMVEHVWMELIAISAIVLMDSRGITVRIISVISQNSGIF